MYLLIDQGNSRCKYLLTPELQPVETVRVGVWENKSFDDAHWREQLSNLCQHPLKKVIVSSVASQARKEWFKKLCRDVLGAEAVFASTSEQQVLADGSVLSNSYEKPLALGVDRWLVMLAAMQRSKADFLVLDAGTAITLDLVDNTGKHQGGHIVPGMALLQESLLGKTESIAWSAGHDIKLDGELLGRNTSAAVEYGAKLMVHGYIKEVLEQLEERGLLPESIFVTGGGAAFVEEIKTQLSAETTKSMQWIYCPNLVFEGLSSWFSLNN